MAAVLLNNRYQILKTLGRGGFSETFLAVDTHMPSARKCVIKQLQPTIQKAKLPSWLQERFQREAAILEELGENHRQIPRLYAYFSEADNFFLVQEWIEGITLTQRQQQGNLAESEVRQILLDLLPVLDYVHQRRIIHRDIKPDNIILRATDDKPVLIDFGIVKEAIATAVTPNSKRPYSAVLGTPGYMASEQAAGRPVYSSDLYSLGLTAVFLLSGKTPQYLANDPQTGDILWQDCLPPLHSNLASVLDSVIRFHPRDRLASAREMLKALQTSSEPDTVPTIAVAPGTLHRRTRPRVATRPTPTASSSPTNAVVENPKPNNTSLNWLWLTLLFGGTIAGGLGLGYWLINRSAIIPQPSPTPKEIEPFETETEPQPFRNTAPAEPSLRQPEQAPAPRRTQPKQSQPKATVTPKPNPPKPETSASPKPKAAPSPDANIPAAPQPTVSPAVQPKATTPPQTQSTPSPQPDVAPIPDTPATQTQKPPESTASPPPASAPQPPGDVGGIRPEPPPAPPQPKAVPETEVSPDTP